MWLGLHAAVHVTPCGSKAAVCSDLCFPSVCVCCPRRCVCVCVWAVMAGCSDQCWNGATGQQQQQQQQHILQIKLISASSKHDGWSRGHKVQQFVWQECFSHCHVKTVTFRMKINIMKSDFFDYVDHVFSPLEVRLDYRNSRLPLKDICGQS